MRTDSGPEARRPRDFRRTRHGGSKKKVADRVQRAKGKGDITLRSRWWKSLYEDWQHEKEKRKDLPLKTIESVTLNQLSALKTSLNRKNQLE